jgi:hypothetical protein
MKQRQESLLAFYRRWRFLVLLCALVLLLCGEPLAIGLDLPVGVFDVLLLIVVAAAILSHAEHRFFCWIGAAAGGASVLLTVCGYSLADPAGLRLVLAGHVLGAAFLIGSALVTVSAALRSRELTLDSVFGVVCGYLLLGVAWALFYSLADYLDPASFRMSDELSQRASSPSERISVFLYFSFITLATLGYGDITPVAAPTRTMAWLEAVVGQLYLAVLVAGLVGALIAREHEKRRAP